eukprot:CAMPEP_0201490690 /NCGR_PEP_ID=MMETSP0151_2-20130828/27021_1 /ASSEMBLY_ACC=CAM_ASM_000257 /TAXON_ID=200890 /ORGANISM="Paramoeba atlantica, Strain 621/1 / CCAP 1560/9" /LENGTH=73 /DNA_ID=CAMNT_0047876731 /DNA_START=77 /DNA_END=297 /DNA_ORIENTATION=+
MVRHEAMGGVRGVELQPRRKKWDHYGVGKPEELKPAVPLMSLLEMGREGPAIRLGIDFEELEERDIEDTEEGE